VKEAASYPIRQWGEKPRTGEPQVYLEAGVFAEAILWGRQNAGDEYGLIFGNQAAEPERVVIAERFVGEGQSSDAAGMELVGALFWRHDGSIALSPDHAVLMREHGNPSLALVLDTSRRGWSLYLHSAESYQKLTSVSIYQRHGTQVGLDKTLALLGQIPWSEAKPEPVAVTADEGYHLAKTVHTSRKAFLWGGLAGLFLGAIFALVIATVWGGWQPSSAIDRLGLMAGKGVGEDTGAGSVNEQARTQARLHLERALAGNPDEILGFCSDVVSREQCREALDRLRIAPQTSLSYNPEGVQVSTTVPGLPAYLFMVDAADDGFRITRVQELTPPVELGIKTVPKENGKEKKNGDEQKKGDDKPVENNKTAGEQTQIVGGKVVAP
jgi:hypothetical protein